MLARLRSGLEKVEEEQKATTVRTLLVMLLMITHRTRPSPMDDRYCAYRVTRGDDSVFTKKLSHARM